MIDVIGCCVVRMRNGERMPKYAALSYVWGRVSTLLCTKGNKHDLETPGSLDRVPYCDNLARTIKDAMKLTESLGLRYLWADMICIVQDDPYDKLVQLPNMANIYGDAYFTIVAADGTDSQSGIGGISDDRALTVPTLLSFGALSSAMTFAVKPDAEESREKIWHTRGWTMQERALSRRTLMFLDQTVSWACMQASFDEETYLPDPSDEEKNCYYCQASRASDQTTLTAAKWPDYDNYARLVSLFTERQLTCADDILNAFTGIMAALQPSFPHGFLQGLPEFFFDIAVLWRRTASNFGHLPFWPTRRCVKPGKIWASEYFASWSWAGWEGCRAQWYPIYNDAVDYDMEVITTTPSVVWQKLDKPDNASEIRNDFFRYRKSSQNTQNESEGWETVHEETQSPSSAAMAVRFTHPEAPGQKFYYPLPIAKRTVQQPNINPGTVHLTFRGAVCRFTFRKEAFKSTYPQGSLHSADETWVGFMHDILIPVSREDTDLLACEVVCLSEGYVNVNREYLVERWELEWVEDAVPEVAHFPQIRQAGYVYHFYNVMWLAWEDGIAYRRGLGRIWKPMWEKQELNEMEIVLG